MLEQAKEILSWYDNMREPVPAWYSKGYYLQYMDNIPFKLKSAFDFSFVKEYGTVFRIYDDQDSGNICFGTEKDGQRTLDRVFRRSCRAVQRRSCGCCCKAEKRPADLQRTEARKPD